MPIATLSMRSQTNTTVSATNTSLSINVINSEIDTSNVSSSPPPLSSSSSLSTSTSSSSTGPCLPSAASSALLSTSSVPSSPTTSSSASFQPSTSVSGSLLNQTNGISNEMPTKLAQSHPQSHSVVSLNQVPIDCDTNKDANNAGTSINNPLHASFPQLNSLVNDAKPLAGKAGTELVHSLSQKTNLNQDQLMITSGTRPNSLILNTCRSPNTSRLSLNSSSNSSPNGSQFLLPSRIAALSSNLILCKNRWKQLTKGLRSRGPSASLLNQQSKNCIEALQSHQKCANNAIKNDQNVIESVENSKIDADNKDGNNNVLACKALVCKGQCKSSQINCKVTSESKDTRKTKMTNDKLKSTAVSTSTDHNVSAGECGKANGVKKETKLTKIKNKLSDDTKKLGKKCKRLTKEDLKEQNLARTLKSVDCKDLTLMQILALKSLEFTVPATALVSNSKTDQLINVSGGKQLANGLVKSDDSLLSKAAEWIQLAGHQQAFTSAPIPGRIWKRNDRNELRVYQHLFEKDDPITKFMPKFHRVVTCSQPVGQQFIELQDLLQQFHNPRLMDIKMGCRTFLEEEVRNKCARPDLYEKLIKIDPSAATPEEHTLKAITKLRYMMFRENMSSSSTLSFRIEAFRCGCNEIINDFKYLRRREDVRKVLQMFLPVDKRLREDLLIQLRQLKTLFQQSDFFARHELIGSSLLIIHDTQRIGVWMIDFAKTLPVPQELKVDHNKEWTVGNHEDGYLRGLTNLIDLLQQLI